MSALSPDEIEQFSRQLILPGWSAAKQERISKLRVAVSSELPSSALYLVALGVRDIQIVGPDTPIRTWLLERLRKLNPAAAVCGLSAQEEVSGEYKFIGKQNPAGNLSDGCLVALSLLKSEH